MVCENNYVIIARTLYIVKGEPCKFSADMIKIGFTPRNIRHNVCRYISSIWNNVSGSK